MFWLYLLGVVTLLMIALRRVLRRQRPLNDEIYLHRVAIEHVQSGVARVGTDGTFAFVNQSFASTLGMTPREFVGQEWYKIFAACERARAKDAFAQMLLGGVTSLDAHGIRADGALVWLNVRLVAVHDHNLRYAGHHCLIEDQTCQRALCRMLIESGGARRESTAPALPLATTR
jgi:PAS domain S-box-containing protein